MTNLINTKEYKHLQTILFKQENIVTSIVGEIEGIPHLIAFSESRLFLVKKQIDIFVEVQQFGLEEIFDIKTNVVGEVFDIVIYIKNKPIIKIDYLLKEHTDKFISKLFENIIKWISHL